MTKNVGTLDRAARIVLGIALLAVLGMVDGSLRWIGLLGFVMLGTAAIGSCPIYSVLGLSSCPVNPKSASPKSTAS